MARLVPVRVVTNQPRDVFDVRELLGVHLRIKQGIELGDKPLVSTHGSNQASRVLRYVPCVLLRIPFGVIAVVTGRTRIERITKLAITLASPNESRLWIKNVAP